MRLRSLLSRVRDGLEEIVDLAEPRPGWVAAAGEVLRRVERYAQAGPADAAARQLALEAVDTLAAALIGVPARVEAKNIGLGW